MFKIKITKTIKFKKIFEVIKDVFPEVYLQANVDGILLYQKSPSSINDIYILIAKLNNFENFYTFENTDYETEYLRIFDTNQIYKCIKNLTQTNSIDISNENEFIILENKEKRIKHKVKYSNRNIPKNFLNENIDISKPLGSFILNAREYTTIIKNIKSSDEFTEISLKLHHLKNGTKKLDFYTASVCQEFFQPIITKPHPNDAFEIPEKDIVVCEKCFFISYLILFIKSINLNSTMCLHFYEKGMMIQYEIDGIGQMVFYLNDSTSVNSWE